MTQEAVMKYIKAVAGVLALVGVVITPDQAESISSGFLAVYAIITGVQARIKQKQGK